MTSKKAYAFLATIGLTLLMSRLGISPEDLALRYGVTFGDAQTLATSGVAWVADFILQTGWAGLAASFMGWVWPSEPDKGIRDYLGTAAKGLGIIVVIILLVLAVRVLV